jgi:type I restriction enzyme S subunit
MSAPIGFSGSSRYGWGKKRLKYISQSIQTGPFGSQLHADDYVDDGIPVINPSDLSNGALDGHEAVTISEATFTRLRQHALRAGDILFARRGELGRCALVHAHAEGWLCGTGCIRVRPRTSQIDPTFLNWVLAANYVREWLMAESVGATMENLSAATIAMLPLCVPSIREQRRISAFLERRCNEVDDIIAKKGRMLALLAEQKSILTTRAVTRGLDPDAQVKDSGIPWIGQVPSRWSIKRLRSALRNIEQGWSPQCENRIADADEWAVLKVGCVNGGVFNELEHKALPSDVVPLTEYEIKDGDVLLSRANTRELLGSAALVRTPRQRLLLCDKLYRLHLRSELLNAQYLISYLASAPARYQLEREATGSSESMQNIGQDSIRNLVVPTPCSEEQERITGFLTDVEDSFRATGQTILVQIERFHEYRTALITAAVTGQIDVTNPKVATAVQ